MEEIEIKYGIRHNNGKVIAITEFLDGKVAEGFTEITQQNYIDFTASISANPFSTYDAELKQIVPNVALGLAAMTAKARDAYRRRLRDLSAEIDLMARMGEDATGRQAEFDQIKQDYQALKPPEQQ